MSIIAGAAQGAAAGSAAGPYGAIAGGVLGGISGAFGASGKRAARRAAKAQRRIEALTAFRERVQAVRQSRMQSAEIAARAGNEGLLGASSVQGTLGGITSQLGAAFSFANQVDKQNAIIRKNSEKAAKQADIAGGVMSLASMTSNLPAGFGGDTASSFFAGAKELGQNAGGAVLSFFAPRAAGQSQSFNQTSGIQTFAYPEFK